VTDGVPGPLKAPAEIHVFGEHEVPFVESAYLLEGLAANEGEGTTHPVDTPITARLPIAT
jgi:hypothetical protein